MDENIRLCDSYQWLDDVLAMPVDAAGMCFFSNLGYVSEGHPVKLRQAAARSFVYALLPESVILDDLDRLYLETIKSGAYLFDLEGSSYPKDSEDVAVFAIDMSDVGSARTDEAYGIHVLLSKCYPYKSIVLFRHEGSILLSFLYRNEGSGVAIYLSDWLNPLDPDDGQLERMYVASTTLESADDCFEGFAFEAMRDYYKHPLTYYSAWYDVVLGPLDVSWQLDPTFYSREELQDAIEEAMYSTMLEYGDDYMEDKIKQVDLDDDFDLEEIEWELQNTEDSEEIVTADGEDNVMRPEDSPVGSLTMANIPSEVFDDPVTLLEWINSHSAAAIDFDSNSKHEVDSELDTAYKRAIVHWKPSLSLEPLAVGSHVISRELGEGIVNRSSLEDISVEFENARRLFKFPKAFETGTLTLLE